MRWYLWCKFWQWSIPESARRPSPYRPLLTFRGVLILVRILVGETTAGDRGDFWILPDADRGLSEKRIDSEVRLAPIAGQGVSHMICDHVFEYSHLFQLVEEIGNPDVQERNFFVVWIRLGFENSERPA